MDNNNSRPVAFHEEYQVPFCEPFKCQLTKENGSDVATVLWDCVPDDCKLAVMVLLGFIVMLAAMTVTFNCLILGINLASKTRRMRKRNPIMSNYSIYVVSLAVADLLVGVAVLPLCVVNLYLEFLSNPLQNSNKPQDIRDEAEILVVDDIQLRSPQARINLISSGVVEQHETNVSNVHSTHKDESSGFSEGMAVRAVLGMFTHLTLFVSIYTLITASADRFYAASHSVHLTSSQLSRRISDKKKTDWLRQMTLSVKRSTVAVIIVWICGIIFALIPLAMRNIFYFRHVGHIFAAMTSVDYYSTGVRWYLFTLVIPLIGMWILNVMICFTLWRRKRQLGLRRKKSLHYKPPPTSPTENLNSGIPSNSDSVFEYEIKSSNDIRSPKSPSEKPSTSTHNSLYRKKVSSESNGRRTPCSFRSLQWDSKATGLRRKVSSLRRAKELLKRQSYEANITKTLCIVVVAFTLAVLPLIVTLGTITLGYGSSKSILNKEVTALSCSLLLLFSNSFANCVIYGARMRDFRTTLCQLLRNFIDKIKNALCCYCLRSNDNISSEIVNGVFLVSKRQRSELLQKSPRFRGSSGHNIFFPSNATKLSITSTLDNRSNYTKSELNMLSQTTKILVEGASSEQIKTNGQKLRPSSSGYRTDPDSFQNQEENDKRNITLRRKGDWAESHLSVRTSWRTSSLIETEKILRSSRLVDDDVSPETSPKSADNQEQIQTKFIINDEVDKADVKLVETNDVTITQNHCDKEGTPKDSFISSKEEFSHEKSVKDIFISEDTNNTYRDEFVDANDKGTHASDLRQSSDFTLGIDFSNFSSL